jgi:putative oxidoreductase
MKHLFKVHQHPLHIDFGILLARITIALLMLAHGFPKMLMLFSGGPIQFPPVLFLNAETSLALAVFAEVLASVMILAGFWTRLATIPLMITMLVALLVVHGTDPFAAKELALIYLLVYMVLFITGSGRFSVDSLNSKFKKSKIQAVVERVF